MYWRSTHNKLRHDEFNSERYWSLKSHVCLFAILKLTYQVNESKFIFAANICKIVNSIQKRNDGFWGSWKKWVCASNFHAKTNFNYNSSLFDWSGVTARILFNTARKFSHLARLPCNHACIKWFQLRSSVKQTTYRLTDHTWNVKHAWIKMITYFLELELSCFTSFASPPEIWEN